MKAYDLRCAYLTNPMGIDVAVPCLGWKLAATPGVRGEAQTAYQIRAAGKQVLREEADLWESGWVPSADTVQIPYGGKPLAS
ncbi:MAG: hypothetical protein ACNA71_10250, partial [Kiritimatiellia bacterium]